VQKCGGESIAALKLRIYSPRLAREFARGPFTAGNLAEDSAEHHLAEIQYPKIRHFKDIGAFRAQVTSLGLKLPLNDQILSAQQNSPMAQPLDVGGFVVGNRWCVHPMEGWDGTTTGEPSEHTIRRWDHFGRSGCKLIWGGEAFCVQSDGRANTNQIGIVDGDVARAEKGARTLFQTCVDAHREVMGKTDDLLLGLQLTHSGRFCRPFDKKKLEPKIAYHHPILDAKFGIDPKDDSVVISDDYIARVIENYIIAAKLAQRVGFQFVDVKACHGYLGHEMLSAFTRPGKYGGSLENRTRFAREIIQGIQAECPGMMIGVRLSVFDHPPFKPDPTRGGNGKLGPGIPEEFKHLIPYVYGFGCNQNNPLEMDLSEPIEFINALAKLGVRLINASCCSPYYNPHYQRPAMFPPSDGYQPPEDPLVGVARQIEATRVLKENCRDSFLVGTGYTYLQEYLPHVAQAAVQEGWTDFVGLGRMVLSYWEIAADTLAGRAVHTKKICRTFSDCTTAPRNGLISGCFPLDPHYKEHPVHVELKQKKDALRKSLTVVQ
jgi:2,4-dienoyl-CoA reductase-like NADH-dependent reductase (Old Yellow Enzyme family)